MEAMCTKALTLQRIQKRKENGNIKKSSYHCLSSRPPAPFAYCNFMIGEVFALQGVGRRGLRFHIAVHSGELSPRRSCALYQQHTTDYEEETRPQAKDPKFSMLIHTPSPHACLGMVGL